MCYVSRDSKGFTLIEIIVAVAIFLIFAIGIYSGIQFIFKSVYQSRLRIIETGILNEQVEIIRNLSFHSVGIVNGSPAGTLERTVTTTRNGIGFTITRTIRNVDDPFDGTIGGDPNDLSPADYKIAEVEIICNNCTQKEPVSISTRVAPKYLEGDPNNGALFIEVFDANAIPVQGATVHVVATTTDPAFDFTDTTDNEGYLRIVDLPSAVTAYNITVSKNGYTTDQTIEPSEENPNPIKPPSSVIAQDVTSISFTIDKAASLAVNTLDLLCDPIANVPVPIIGTKLIGAEPDIYITNQTITTNSSGSSTLANLVWDAYGLQATGYDLIGAIPGLPTTILPGTNNITKLILDTDTNDSLLIQVLDSATQQPLSNATVSVTSTNNNEQKITGFGHIRQTDWSGGSGQEILLDPIRYATDDGNIDATSAPGDITLQQVGNNYASSGELESSIFDLGIDASYVNLVWEPLNQPVEAGSNALQFQIATNDSTSTPTWTYLGPDGTSGTYYNPNSTAINAIHDGERYFRYKAYFQTASTTFTPRLSDVSLPYTNSCTPPGQVHFANLVAEEVSVEVTRAGYQTSTQQVTVSEDVVFTINMVAE